MPKANSCPATYGAPVANTFAAASPVAASTTQATVVVPVGAGGDATPKPTLVISSTASFLGGATAPSAIFATSACPAVYGTTPANASDVLKTANNRGAVTLPTGAAATAGAQTALALRSAVT